MGSRVLISQFQRKLHRQPGQPWLQRGDMDSPSYQLRPRNTNDSHRRRPVSRQGLYLNTAHDVTVSDSGSGGLQGQEEAILQTWTGAVICTIVLAQAGATLVSADVAQPTNTVVSAIQVVIVDSAGNILEVRGGYVATQADLTARASQIRPTAANDHGPSTNPRSANRAFGNTSLPSKRTPNRKPSNAPVEKRFPLLSNQKRRGVTPPA